MARRPIFKLWHSAAGLAALLVLEGTVLALVPQSFGWLVALCAVAGAAVALYVSTEAIEEVRGTPHMLKLLAAIASQYIVFFAFQYWFLVSADPASFATLPADVVSYLLQSTMVFAFNPLYQPGDAWGRLLLLVDTLGSLGLVLFILQNIWQLRR